MRLQIARIPPGPILCVLQSCPNPLITDDTSYVFFYEAERKTAVVVHWECLGLEGVNLTDKLVERIRSISPLITRG